MTFGISYDVGELMTSLIYKPIEMEYFPYRFNKKDNKFVIKKRLNERNYEPLLNNSRNNISSIDN